MGSPFTVTDLEQAWEHVRENEGCAGVDGITIERFGINAQVRLKALQGRIADGSYRPLPLMKILVEKKPGSGTTRRLLVPPVVDRIVQTAAARRLSASFEEEFLDSSYAYRPGRSVDRAIARIIQFRDRGFVFLVDADVTAFFDEVDHAILLELLEKQNLSMELSRLLKQWIGAEFWDGKRVGKLRKGIAQGSPLSPLLANFFLDEFDYTLERTDHHLVRFADDFVILCLSPAEAEKAMAMTVEWMKSRSLELKAEKTRTVSFKEGFHFLGVYFVEDRVYTPWKGERPKGKILFVASPMPHRMLERYTVPVGQSTMEHALEKAHLPVMPPPDAGGGYVAFLYLTEQGAVLRKSGDRFLVEKEDRVLLDLPYHKLENVLLFGNIQVTTQAIGELLEKGIPVSFFTRQGRFRGMLAPPQGKDVLLRIAQFTFYSDGGRSLEMARRLIGSKIANGLAVLWRYGENEGRLREMEEAMGQLERARADTGGAETLASLEGIEGSAARAYFSTLMKFNRSGFIWSGRNKHPASDPLNALLSLGYTLVMHELCGMLEGLGLDPCLGFLHQPDFGRPSLALDLLEVFRHPVVDRMVLHMVNRKTFQEDDFHGVDGQDGIHLSSEGLKRFVEGYEQWMLMKQPAGPPFRKELREEAEGLVKCLRKEAEWAPFAWERGEEACSTSSATT